MILPRSPRGEFRNEPFVNFHDSANFVAMEAALGQVADMLGYEYQLVIGGERLRTEEKIQSFNPANPSQVVGIHQKAGAEHAEMAMKAALTAYESWKHVPVEERASLLLHAAEIIRARKFEFCAWLTYEVGKNWGEADARRLFLAGGGSEHDFAADFDRALASRERIVRAVDDATFHGIIGGAFYLVAGRKPRS